MSKRGNSNLFEVLVRQIAENGRVNVVFGKAPSVSPETESLKPIHNLPQGDRVKKCVTLG
jgi:hypothetical protein